MNGRQGFAALARMKALAMEGRGPKGQAPRGDTLDRSDPLTLASLADLWLLRLEVRAYSPRTVRQRRDTLRGFVGWAETRDLFRPAQIDKPVLEAFQRWLWTGRKANGQPLSINTQRIRLGTVQGFFGWLCRENILRANPAADLELPREQARSLPRVLSAEEIGTILAVPDVRNPFGLRDRAMLEILYATGLRRRELAQLDQADHDPARGVLHVRRGKGGKNRLVPMGGPARFWLGRYLSEVRPRLEIGAGEPALFLNGYGRRFEAGALGQHLTDLLRGAGIKSGGCHLLRHACATHLLENGADLRLIQELLGHANVDTTQLYTAVSIHQLRETHARCHPRGGGDRPEAPAPEGGEHIDGADA